MFERCGSRCKKAKSRHPTGSLIWCYPMRAMHSLRVSLTIYYDWVVVRYFELFASQCEVLGSIAILLARFSLYRPDEQTSYRNILTSHVKYLAAHFEWGRWQRTVFCVGTLTKHLPCRLGTLTKIYPVSNGDIDKTWIRWRVKRSDTYLSRQRCVDVWDFSYYPVQWIYTHVACMLAPFNLLSTEYNDTLEHGVMMYHYTYNFHVSGLVAYCIISIIRTSTSSILER
jgi:hypothetical protein